MQGGHGHQKPCLKATEWQEGSRAGHPSGSLPESGHLSLAQHTGGPGRNFWEAPTAGSGLWERPSGGYGGSHSPCSQQAQRKPGVLPAGGGLCCPSCNIRGGTCAPQLQAACGPPQPPSSTFSELYFSGSHKLHHSYICNPHSARGCAQHKHRQARTGDDSFQAWALTPQTACKA